MLQHHLGLLLDYGQVSKKDSQQSELKATECELVSVGSQPVLWHHPAVQ